MSFKQWWWTSFLGWQQHKTHMLQIKMVSFFRPRSKQEIYGTFLGGGGSCDICVKKFHRNRWLQVYPGRQLPGYILVNTSDQVWKHQLVGGFNPLEEYESKMGSSSPSLGVKFKKKKKRNHHLDQTFCWKFQRHRHPSHPSLETPGSGKTPIFPPRDRLPLEAKL